MGSYLAGPISGAHMNPAVAIALWCFRSFPGSKVFVYTTSQMLGGFLAAAGVYANYWEVMNLYDGGIITVPGVGSVHPTAGIFSTYPAHGIGSLSSFVSEFTAAFVLMLGISAVTSPRSASRSSSSAFAVFILMLCIGCSYGWQTGYAINAARDLAPRCFSWLIYGNEVFSAGSYYWWIPVVAPLFGCFAGCFVWNVMVGEDDPNDSKRW